MSARYRGETARSREAGSLWLRRLTLEEPTRVASVDISHERWTDVVPEELLESLGQLPDDGPGHAQEVVLLGPEPRRHVLEDHAQAGPVGGVGPAPVPDTAQIEQHRAHRHLRRDRGGVRFGLLESPAVAPGDDASGAVGLGEVV